MKRRSKYNPRKVEPYLIKVDKVAEQLDRTPQSIYWNAVLMPFKISLIGVRIFSQRFYQVLAESNGDPMNYRKWAYEGAQRVKPAVLAKLADCSEKTINNIIKEGYIESCLHEGVGRLCKVDSFFDFINKNKVAHWK